MTSAEKKGRKGGSAAGKKRESSVSTKSGANAKLRKDAQTTPKAKKRSNSPVAGNTRSSSKKKKTKTNEKPEIDSATPTGEEESPAAAADPTRSKESHADADGLADHSLAPKTKRSSKGDDDDRPVSDENDKTTSSEEKLVKKRRTSAPAKKLPPSMDVSVHRVRHLNYRPRPILCLAGTPFDEKAADYVALSRESGTVELKSPDEKWRTVASVAGMSSRTVDVMAWTCGTCSDAEMNDASSSSSTLTFSSTFHQTHTKIQSRRTCLGASRDGTIFVVDFLHGTHAAVTGSGGGGVFSLVSLCGKRCCSAVDCPRLVAAGCQDGSIRIYQLVVKEDGNKTFQLELVSTVPCAGTAILSLVWRRTEKASFGLGGTVLFAGVADGTIRRLDCVSALTKARLTGTSAHVISTGTVVSNESQSWKSTLRMTVESYGRTAPTRVWALEALADGTLVSGDSLGHVQLWDGDTGTLLQSFDQNDSKADVLTLAVSANECRVFASGVDSRVICVERSVTTASTNSGPPKWVMTHAHRPHTHDIKAMTMCKQRDYTGCLLEGKVNEILCTGGMDTKLCTYSIKDFGKFRPKSLYPWPCVSPISVANEARILAMRREDRVDLYKLAPHTTVTVLPVPINEEETLVGTIEFKGRHNFACSDICGDGQLLVVSNATGLTLFELNYIDNKNGMTSLQPSRVEIERSLRIPCLALKFVSNNRLACAGLDGNIHILKVAKDPHRMTIEHSFPASTGIFAIQLLHVSPDGKWLAAERSGVESGTVQVYSIVEDNNKHWWSLPALESPITASRFICQEKTLLAVACANCAIYVFDIEARSLSTWSEKLGIPMRDALPIELSRRLDFPVRITSNPATPNMFLMGFFGAFSAIDTNKALPEHCRVFPETHVRGRKRKWNSTGPGGGPQKTKEKRGEKAVGNGNCTICLRYNSMLFMDFVAKNEMLVVEQPWLNVVASFPQALERKLYGT